MKMYLNWFTLREIKIALVLALVLLLVKYLSKKFSRDPRWDDLSKKLPGPYALPIIGNIIHLALGTKDGVERLFSHYASIYGPTFRLWIGNRFVVVLSDVEDIQTVLFSTSCIEKPDLFLCTREYFGKSLPLVDHEEWKHKRKAYQPLFTKNYVLSQLTIMNQQNNEFIEKVKKLVDGPETDWNNIKIFKQLPTNSFTKIYFNFDINVEKIGIDLNLIPQALTKGLERCAVCMMLNCPALLPIWNWLQPLNFSKIKGSFKNFTDKVVELSKKSNETFAEEENEDISINSASTPSFYQTLERLRKELSDDELTYDEIISFLFGATESSAVTVASCLFALAEYSDIQEKVYEEIYGVFGEDERPAERTDLEKLSYLDQVIKETHRLFSVIPQISRQSDSEIKIGPHIYPTGTTFIINIGSVHHDPKLYPNPYRFNPDNFSSEAIGTRHRCSYIPFSAGPRDCLGKVLAEVSIKLRLVALLRAFTFQTTKKIEDMKFRPGIVTKSTSGYPMSITLRKKFIFDKN